MFGYEETLRDRHVASRPYSMRMSGKGTKRVFNDLEMRRKHENNSSGS